METQVFRHKKEFNTERGFSLPEFKLSYTTYGKLNHDKSNLIWVIHALTGNSKVHDWWPNIFGSDKFLDPQKYFIICVNNLGSPYGSTSPLSTNPKTGKPYYKAFPSLTINDLVNTYQILAQHLEIKKINTMVGPSLGGQQALQWAINFPNQIENLVLVATNAVHSAYGKAFNATQRLAIKNDKTWGENNDDAGKKGLKLARSIAMLSYRSYNGFKAQQDVGACDEGKKVESYLNYQGNKLASRFNAYSYYLLTKVMDSHNVAKNYGSINQALAQVKARALVIGINSDVLFPVCEQQFIYRNIKYCQIEMINSEYGHDGFLIEQQLNEIITNWYLRKPREYQKVKLNFQNAIWS
ncbi:MAG: homoserine O-acetyltransferase [Bacteroidia bacterium]